jgi:hypothetical protein
MTQISIALWVISIAFSIYLITQTSGRGIPRKAASARTTAIVLGFIPCVGIPLIFQFINYSKYRSLAGAHEQFYSSKPRPPAASAPSSGNPFLGNGNGAAAPKLPSQPANNPFLAGSSSAASNAAPAPAAANNPFLSGGDQPTTAADGSTSKPSPPANNPFLNP